MAKSLRSKKQKANKASLRARVFGPVERARKERLSSKLQDVVAGGHREGMSVDGNSSQSSIGRNQSN